MVPDAPGRFSTTTGWPSCVCSRSPSARAMTSVALPGVKATMMRSGLEGQACAAAGPAAASSSVPSTHSNPRLISLLLIFSVGLDADVSYQLTVALVVAADERSEIL